MPAIKTEKMLVNDSDWKVYWTPAPPKWDMAPAYVKQILFPDYHGAEYNIRKSALSTKKIDATLNDVASSFETVEIGEEVHGAVPLKLRCISELIILYFTINPELLLSYLSL